MAESPVLKRVGAPRVFDPFHAFADFDRLFGALEPRIARSTDAPFLAPALDLHESDNDIVLTAELPGIAESDVDIQIEDGVLTLKGEKRYEKRDEKDAAHMIERKYGAFRRSFTLPDTIDEDGVSARFDKGVLTITLPKKATAVKTPKKISIS